MRSRDRARRLRDGFGVHSGVKLTRRHPFFGTAGEASDECDGHARCHIFSILGRFETLVTRWPAQSLDRFDAVLGALKTLVSPIIGGCKGETVRCALRAVLYDGCPFGDGSSASTWLKSSASNSIISPRFCRIVSSIARIANRYRTLSRNESGEFRSGSALRTPPSSSRFGTSWCSESRPMVSRFRGVVSSRL